MLCSPSLYYTCTCTWSAYVAPYSASHFSNASSFSFRSGRGSRVGPCFSLITLVMLVTNSNSCHRAGMESVTAPCVPVEEEETSGDIFFKQIRVYPFNLDNTHAQKQYRSRFIHMLVPKMRMSPLIRTLTCAQLKHP